jgi:hypothetical protein
LLLKHPLALRCKIGRRRLPLSAADRGECEKQKTPRDASHARKDNAAYPAAKEALSFAGYSLPHYFRGVHLTHPVSQKFDDMRCKVGRLLNQKVETILFDFR